uniref:Uncharacterized protein n=1 Tax=Arundo donax TaxID=35708 RepID=A0A0A8Z3S1_ARUDO
MVASVRKPGISVRMSPSSSRTSFIFPCSSEDASIFCVGSLLLLTR